MTRAPAVALGLGFTLALAGAAVPAPDASDPVTHSPGTDADAPLGRGAAFGVLAAEPTVSVRAGTPLRSRPEPTAEALVRIPTAAELPILQRSGDWVRTHYGDWTGWVAPDGEATAARPNLAVLGLSPLVLDTSVPQRAARVASARSFLGPENPTATTLGPWPLYSDVADSELLGRLRRLAEHLPALYAERFGLEPSLEEPPAVVLFAREADYRRFTEELTDVGELHAGGHADDAMAALFAEGRAEDVAAVAVHELTHLLNRRRFARPPLTWLEEGLADDLGLSRLGEDGGIELGSLGGEATMVTERYPFRPVVLKTVHTGGQSVRLLVDRLWAERRPGLDRMAALLDMNWTDFVGADQGMWHYGESLLFVRYLLDHAPAARRDAFHRFLRAAADGAPSGGSALAAELGTSPQALQDDFERWLTASMVRSR
jgi:hypothetical protein